MPRLARKPEPVPANRSTTIPLQLWSEDHRVRLVIVVPSPAAPSVDGTQASRQVEALIIDRQPLFQAALGNLLKGPPLLARVLSSSSSDVGLEMARTVRFDVVFCEVRAQPVSGLQLVEMLMAEGNEARVVLLAEEGDESQLAPALNANAAGLFTKNANLQEFMVGVQAVLSGHRAFGSSLMGPLVKRLTQPPLHDPRRFANQLSPTELAILSMVGHAHSIPAIAATRGISHKTVRNHLARIYRKLELHGRTEAMLWAARMGLTEG